MTMPVVLSVNGLCNVRFPVWVSGAVDYESTIVQCSPSGFSSCLGNRAQRLKCRGLETSSLDSDYLTLTEG
ncbi:hypothetical protein TNCV_1709591 [Trichonephila clavipes]|nr:hypothetical protein TNCV_1709591 [Trichonephila clavipes]